MAMKLKSGFEILRFSDLKYEEMTVEIQYLGEQIAQINMDRGFDKLEIELFTEFANIDFSTKFDLTSFLDAIDKAIKILKDCIPQE